MIDWTHMVQLWIFCICDLDLLVLLIKSSMLLAGAWNRDKSLCTIQVWFPQDRDGNGFYIFIFIFIMSLLLFPVYQFICFLCWATFIYLISPVFSSYFYIQVKHPEVAQFLGGRLYDCVFKYNEVLSWWSQILSILLSLFTQELVIPHTSIRYFFLEESYLLSSKVSYFDK